MKRQKKRRCWEFFHCSPSLQGGCLMPEVSEDRCWLLNIACCQMPSDVPHPLSVKKVVCKTCAYYAAYKDSSKKSPSPHVS